MISSPMILDLHTVRALSDRNLWREIGGGFAFATVALAAVVLFLALTTPAALVP